MDGIMLTSNVDHKRQVQSKKRQGWRKLFLKLDDISARLIAFSDKSQLEVCWSVPLVGADISTPIPGELTQGIKLDEEPHCFYVRETSATKDCTHYFSVPDDKTKKEWVKSLTRVARNGPRLPRFTISNAGNDYEFHARVVKARPHADDTHAEYMITCWCQVYSRLVARRLMKEWSIWHRFSEFDELYQALKKSLGPQIEGIELTKHKRDAFRGVMGKALDHDFLEARRVLLNSFVANLSAIRPAVEFFKQHSDPHLRAFFRFDENCEDVDWTLRKAKVKGNRSNGLQDASRYSEDDAGCGSTLSRASAARDTASEAGRNRPKGPRGASTCQSDTESRRASTSSQASKGRGHSATSNSTGGSKRRQKWVGDQRATVDSAAGELRQADPTM